MPPSSLSPSGDEVVVAFGQQPKHSEMILGLDLAQQRERKALARDLLAEMRRADRDIAELLARIKTAVAASGSTVTEIHGVGPVVATYLLDH